ncbi:MAG TPA: glucokinase [Luteimonas sp.]|jgi:glucokinase|nr:glucokinase [Luteimonas sp.]
MASASSTAAPVLLADIGGTHARFALADPAAARPLLEHTAAAFPVERFPSLAEAARHYLASAGTAGAGVDARSAVVAVAGPVRDGQARMTNHPWVVSAERLGEALGLADVALVNDFVAQAMAVRQFREGDVAPVGGPAAAIAPPAATEGAATVILGAGTGLGVGVLVRHAGGWLALATEAGHASFAPGTPQEIGILEQLSREFGRVSNERLASGAGLVNLHRALGALAGEDPGNPAPEDVTAGAAAGDPRCEQAVDAFCAIFGAIAGDLVLAFGAWTGAYLSGGLVPPLLPALRRSGFRQRFEGKGRYAPTMAAVPTLAVLHPQPGLLGAAVIAADRAAGAGA